MAGRDQCGLSDWDDDMNLCLNGHEVGEGFAYCGLCGKPVVVGEQATAPPAESIASKGTTSGRVIPPSRPPAPLGGSPTSQPTSRRFALMAIAGAVVACIVVVVVAVVASPSSEDTDFVSDGSDVSEGAGGYVVGPVNCSDQVAGAPAGTDLLEFGVVDSTPEQVLMRATFDAPVPAYVPDPQPGDVTLSLALYLYEDDDDTSPYRLYISTLSGDGYNVQAGRMGSGFIDSSGFDLTVSGETMEISFDPSVLTELDAVDGFPIAGETLVQRFESTSSTLGYEAIAEETCPPR